MKGFGETKGFTEKSSKCLHMADEIAQQVRHLSGNHEASSLTTQNACEVRKGGACPHQRSFSKLGSRNQRTLGAGGTASLGHMVTNTNKLESKNQHQGCSLTSGTHVHEHIHTYAKIRRPTYSTSWSLRTHKT